MAAACSLHALADVLAEDGLGVHSIDEGVDHGVPVEEPWIRKEALVEVLKKLQSSIRRHRPFLEPCRSEPILRRRHKDELEIEAALGVRLRLIFEQVHLWGKGEQA